MEFLRPGGCFITKVFRSQDYNSLLWVLQKFFKKTDVTKPVASRNTSAEIYVVCEGFLAPKSIDPRLLDPAHIFKHVEEEKKPIDVMRMDSNKQKRQRDGYADDAGLIVYKEIGVEHFVQSDEPVEMLGRYNKFLFGKEAQVYVDHASTTSEIRELCTDLKVLGKGDFGHLLKWRVKMRQFQEQLMAENVDQVTAEKEDTKASAEPGPTEEEKAAMEEEKITRELTELAEKAQQRTRKLQRKKREQRSKERRRTQLNLNSSDGMMETPEEQGLFSLAGSTGLRELSVDDETKLPLEETSDEEADVTREFVREDDDEEHDPDLERERVMEDNLDLLYEQYKERRKISTKREKAGLGFGGEEEEDETLAEAARRTLVGDETKGSDDDDDEEDGGDRNPLLVSFGEETKESSVVKAKRYDCVHVAVITLSLFLSFSLILIYVCFFLLRRFLFLFSFIL